MVTRRCRVIFSVFLGIVIVSKAALASEHSASFTAYLKASNTEAYDHFGSSVAISGDTVVVGARGEDSGAGGNGTAVDNSAAGAGAAYVFVRTSTGWEQQAFLKASNAGGSGGEFGDSRFWSDQFGTSVAISGDTIVVGSPNEDSPSQEVNGDESDSLSSRRTGAAYVFVRRDGEWFQEAHLKSSNARGNTYTNNVTGDTFGSAVAISGDTIVVGALRESSNSKGVNGHGFNNSSDGVSTYSGAAFIFERGRQGWVQTAHLKSPTPIKQEYFGSSVAVSGGTVVVGAAGTIGANDVTGAAHVFSRSGSTWSQTAYLEASNPALGSRFGASVAVVGDLIAVGAFNESSDSTGVSAEQDSGYSRASGAVYVFRQVAGQWDQETFIKASNAGGGDKFGASLALSDGVLVVGAADERSGDHGVNADQSDNSTSGLGAVYVFRHDGGAWCQTSYIKPVYDSFGFSDTVGISKKQIVIGASYDASSALGIDGDGDDDSALGSGAAYIIDLEPPTEIRLPFTGLPGLGDWRIMGATDLTHFVNDHTADSVITEIRDGVYEARVNLRFKPPNYFLRAERE